MSRVLLLPDRARPLVFAHRGCSSLAPENTFAAFRKARETGSPGIELDVHPTADGRLVVVHDDTFVRVAPEDNCGGKRPEDLRYDEIRRLDVGSFFGAGFSGERPPLLEEVLEEFCPSLYVDIELKSRRASGDPLPGLLAEKLAAMGSVVRAAVTVSSFNPFCLGAFKKRLRDIPSAVIFSANTEVPWLFRRGFGRFLAACDYLKPEYLQVNARSRFRWSVLEKRPLVPWTVDSIALAENLTVPDGRLPACAGIITNRPQDIGRSILPL